MRKINGFLAACVLTLAAGCGGSDGGSSNGLNLPAGTNALLSVYVSSSAPAALTLDAGGQGRADERAESESPAGGRGAHARVTVEFSQCYCRFRRSRQDG